MILFQNCSSNVEVRIAKNNVYFRLTKPSFLDSTFDLFNNKFLLNGLGSTDAYFHSVRMQYILNIPHKITFRYIKGFDSGTFQKVDLIKVRFNLFQIDFYYSNFDFYLNRSLIRSCGNIDPDNVPKYVFYSISNLVDLVIRFIDCEYKTKICPLLFLNMYIYSIEFNGIQNTFYKTNFPRFLPISNSSFYKSYNFSIFSLHLVNMQNIELNSAILNDFLFYRLNELKLYGDIVSIEKGLFKPFKNLKNTEIDITSTRKLFHRGIDWVFDFNADTNVDIYNLFPFEGSYKLCVLFLINLSRNELTTVSNLDFNFIDYFPNEDFCLYAQFPFWQLILMKFISLKFKEKDYSCTFVWFNQHFHIFGNFCHEKSTLLYEHIHFPLADKKIIDKCNFQQR